MIFEDGQRAYRLRYRVCDCPKFDDEINIRLWKAGYYAARDGISRDAALAELNKKLNKKVDSRPKPC